MSLQPCNEPVCEEMTGAVELVIEPRPKDLGGFEVRRILPTARRKMVGPFIFFDHIGPAEFAAGQGVDVRPHPHIGLATVTYLFEGEILHRDSLGCVQAIRPGAVNWMTAGRGIVHSERTADELRETGSALHGIQSWVALPLGAEECDPDFTHYSAEMLPIIEKDRATMRLIAGTAFGQTAPVVTKSPLYYLELRASADCGVPIPPEHEDRAIYVVDGSLSVGGLAIGAGHLVVLRDSSEAEVNATEGSHLMLLGGERLTGDRHIWWNFVSSSQDRLEHAKRDWKDGRFDKVPGETEFIPLPEP